MTIIPQRNDIPLRCVFPFPWTARLYAAWARCGLFSANPNDTVDMIRHDHEFTLPRKSTAGNRPSPDPSQQPIDPRVGKNAFPSVRTDRDEIRAGLAIVPRQKPD
jgi:hypothetical protein